MGTIVGVGVAAGMGTVLVTVGGGIIVDMSVVVALGAGVDDSSSSIQPTARTAMHRTEINKNNANFLKIASPFARLFC